MTKNRLEAFSDGVIAIIITIMVLELKVPHHDHFTALLPIWPVFLSYVISFVYVGIYWNNHHHLMHLVQKIDGTILWANMFLLFTLSLIPFATAWMGENHFSSGPAALYGLVLLASALAYTLLTRVLLQRHEQHSLLAKAIGRDRKGKFSLLAYSAAVPLALWNSWVACSIYLLMALVWLIPDRRIEKLDTH